MASPPWPFSRWFCGRADDADDTSLSAVVKVPRRDCLPAGSARQDGASGNDPLSHWPQNNEATATGTAAPRSGSLPADQLPAFADPSAGASASSRRTASAFFAASEAVADELGVHVAREGAMAPWHGGRDGHLELAPSPAIPAPILCEASSPRPATSLPDLGYTRLGRSSRMNGFLQATGSRGRWREQLRQPLSVLG